MEVRKRSGDLSPVSTGFWNLSSSEEQKKSSDNVSKKIKINRHRQLSYGEVILSDFFIIIYFLTTER